MATVEVTRPAAPVQAVATIAAATASATPQIAAAPAEPAAPVKPSAPVATVAAPTASAPAPAAQPVASAPTAARTSTTVSAAAARTASLIVVNETRFTNSGAEAVSAGTANIPLRAVPQGRDLVVVQAIITPAPVHVTQDAAGNRVGHFDLSGLAPGQSLTVRQEYHLQVWGHGGSGDDGAVTAAHLRAEAKVEADAPAIVTLAQRLTQGQTTVEGKLQMLFSGTRNALKYSLSSPARNKGALTALQAGSGVCEEYASLFVALCRAAGIPSRIVVGYGRGSSNYETAWGQAPNNLSGYRHAWAEAYVAGYGWAAFDPTLNRSALPGVGEAQIPSGTLIAESYRNQTLSTAYSGGRLQTGWEVTVSW